MSFNVKLWYHVALFLNPRRAGKCGVPIIFREYSRQNLWYTSAYIFPAHVGKTSDPSHLRSGHQSTSSDLTSENVPMTDIATTTERLFWNSHRLLRVTVPVRIKCIYWMEFWYQWPKVRSLFANSKINWIGKLPPMTLFMPLRSSQAMTSHHDLLLYNFC